MSTYDDSTRLAWLAVQDALTADAIGAGLMPAESLVKLATVTYAGADAAAGLPGTPTTTYTTIGPRPTVDPRTQYRNRDGVTQRVGDALLTITRTITEAQLLAADWIDIDGEKYTLVAGEMRREPLYWRVVVKRMQA